MLEVKSFQPRNGLVLIRRIKREKTDAGIIIPDGQYGDYAIGEVIAIGAGTPTTATTTDVDDLTVGSIVMFQSGRQGNPLQGQPGRKNTIPFKVDGEEVELMDERTIFGILNTNGDS